MKSHTGFQLVRGLIQVNMRAYYVFMKTEL